MHNKPIDNNRPTPINNMHMNTHTPSKSDKIPPVQTMTSKFFVPMSQQVIKCDDMFCLEESMNSSTETRMLSNA